MLQTASGLTCYRNDVLTVAARFHVHGKPFAPLHCHEITLSIASLFTCMRAATDTTPLEFTGIQASYPWPDSLSSQCKEHEQPVSHHDDAGKESGCKGGAASIARTAKREEATSLCSDPSHRD